jgi:hypothetical protein
MEADGRVQLVVALEVAGEPIRGTVRVGAAPPVAFSGWLELMSVFELARASAAPTAQVRSG